MKEIERHFVPESEKPDFNFTVKEVFDTLRSPTGRKLEYLGSATSDFQAEPLLYGSDGKPLILSDWEIEVVKNLQGESSHIQDTVEERELPHWRQKKHEYLDRSKELGENTFRFSLDFARLCTKEGEFNEELMADYVKALGLAKARNLEPFLTIYHWPMPNYLVERNSAGEITAGGWEHSEVDKYFRFYVENVVKFLSNQDKVRTALANEGFDKDSQGKLLEEGLVHYFLTINESRSILFDGYVAGIFPPFKKCKLGLYKEIIDKLVEAHDLAAEQKNQKIGNILTTLVLVISISQDYMSN